MATKKIATCDACGSRDVRTRPYYGLLKWFFLVFGGTPTPDGAEIYCHDCDKVIARGT